MLKNIWWSARRTSWNSVETNSCSTGKIMIFWNIYSPSITGAYYMHLEVVLLWGYVHQAQLNVLEISVQQYPDSPKEKDICGWLPLHLTCHNQAPLNVVKFLVEKYPDSVKEIKKYGMLPIHVACEKMAPLIVAKVLFEQCSASVKERGNFRILPLHCACGEKALLDDVVKFLVEQYPYSVK